MKFFWISLGVHGSLLAFSFFLTFHFPSPNVLTDRPVFLSMLHSSKTSPAVGIRKALVSHRPAESYSQRPEHRIADSTGGSEPDPIQPYLKQIHAALQAVLDRQGHPSLQGGDPRLLLQFEIDASGEISHVSIARPSGNPAADQIALHRVQTLKRLAPFPSELKKSSVIVRLPIALQGRSGS